MDTCTTCVWWRKFVDTSLMGACHGGPPAIKHVERVDHHSLPMGYRAWPITDFDDFCASHSKTESKKEQA